MTSPIPTAPKHEPLRLSGRFGRIPRPAHYRRRSRYASRRRAGRGTAAPLFAAVTHPERIASVIVGTDAAAVPLQLGEPLASWVLDPDLGKYRRMDRRAIITAAVETVAGGIPDDIHADELACYDGERFVESMRYVRRYPEELPALADLLPQIATPVTIINGRHGPWSVPSSRSRTITRTLRPLPDDRFP
jgi:pimeloyl-ACP methyl ester carboxylesterase